MAKKNQQLVLAFFDNEAAADAAVDALKQWDKATEDIKLGAVGVLVKDEKGKIKTHKLGKRAGGKGAKTLAVLGVVAGVLSGGVTVLAGAVGGAVLGGVLGSFFHAGLGLSKEDLARIDKELDGGKAAVGLVVEAAEAEAVSAKLAELGGKPETHEVTDEAVEQSTSAAEAAPEAVEAEAAPAAEAAAPATEDSAQK
jgi:uncharacterized membrane protein